MMQPSRSSKRNNAKALPDGPSIDRSPAGDEMRPNAGNSALNADDGHPGPTPLHERGRQDDSDRAYLMRLGERARELRTRRGMSRKILARDSGLSTRYLAQLEAGQGNISILLLRQLTRALDTPLESLVRDGVDPPAELARSVELLRRLSPSDLERAHRLLSEEFSTSDAELSRSRVALIGLRGAGKSTLGAQLANRLGVPFVELDHEIEKESGMPLTTLFDLYGQPAFRRFERRCLDRLVEQRAPMVIATGGSLVSEPATFERLLTSCYTIWIQASPDAHMERVIAQGDMRPMANNREAMSDLQHILKGREPLYQRAHAHIDTTGRTVEEAVEAMLEKLEGGGSALRAK